MCVGGGQGAAGIIEWLGGRQAAMAPGDEAQGTQTEGQAA